MFWDIILASWTPDEMDVLELWAREVEALLADEALRKEAEAN